MTRAFRRDPSTCEHGYDRATATTECPRCADRSNMTRVVAPPRAPQTRWHKTGTTFGPVVKVLLTIVLVVPPLLMAVGLSVARTHPANTFLVVPLAGFVMLDIQLLPAIWAPGRRR